MSMPTPHGGIDDADEALSPASPVAPEPPARLTLTPLARRLLTMGALSVVLGVAAGLVWHAVVRLPVYVVGQNLQAATTERGLAQVFGVDATYALIGAVCGLLLGVLGWRWFGSRGWIVNVIVLVATLVSALTCWVVGIAQGPGDFDPRIAAAKAGDRVPVEFALHTHAVLFVWLFFAVLPLMLFSSFGREVSEG